MTTLHLFRSTMRHDWRAHHRLWLVATAALLVLVALTRSSPWLALGGWTALGMWTANDVLWRSDARLIGRLPISGQALLVAAILRAATRGALFWLGCVIAAPATLLWTTAAWAGTSCLVPAAAAVAAMLVASADADHKAAEIATTPTTLLGVLPGLATSTIGIALGAALLRPEIHNIIAASIVAISVAATLALRGRVPELGLAARTVAQLSRGQFAFVDVHPLTPIESAWQKLLPTSARPYFEKDALQLRRRHPIVGLVGFGAWLWIFGAWIWPATFTAKGHAAWIACAALLLLGLRELAPLAAPREAAARRPFAALLLWLIIFATPGVAWFAWSDGVNSAAIIWVLVGPTVALFIATARWASARMQSHTRLRRAAQ